MITGLKVELWLLDLDGNWDHTPLKEGIGIGD